jgi:peptidyl-dipeptidase Dcp
VHEFTPEVEALAAEVLAYSLDRLKNDPPLDGPRTAEDLFSEVGNTITARGLGGHHALEVFTSVLAKACISTDHPRNLAFIPSAPSEYANLFDLVVGASALYGGSWQEGAGAVFAENQALRWLSDLAGLPPALIEAAAITAKENGMEGKWVFTLQNPSVLPFLQYADNRELRKQIQTAYTNRCNNNNEFDNKALILELTDLKIEKAQMLGYDNYASFVLEDNMAKNPENVYKLLDQLWTPALKMANIEAQYYRDLMKKDGVTGKLEAYDWRYYTEKVRKEKYDLDEEMLKPYFKLENVRDGVFDVSNKLFGLSFKKATNIPLYHPDAEAYEVTNEKGEVVSILYMDYFPRESKRGGAWMDNFRGQYVNNGTKVIPIITINCNFTKPIGDQASLLTFDEAETLFHEFGHALHGMLSDCVYPTTSGTNVPRDFVELPSQIMENWAAEPEVMKTYARHYQTNEPIPDELIAKIEASGDFNQGFATVEYLAASYLDMYWHTMTEMTETDVLVAEQKALNKIGLIPEIVSRYRSTYFSHIFGGGYSSGYYSYIWSEVLDADAFGAFKEKGLFDKTTADSFKKNILSNGHKSDPMTMFVNFRGREPKIDALLEKRGLK